MLTEQASRDRKWAKFPLLRKALEGKPIPSSCYGPTSESDNMFEAPGRLVEIAVLAREHEFAVIETADEQGREGMYRDLNELRLELEATSSFFRQQADLVSAICSKL